MKRHDKLLLASLAAILVLTLGLALPASAKMVKKVDNFIFLVDQSGSMNMSAGGSADTKIERAQKVMCAINKAIPALDYQSAMYLFAPFEGQLDKSLYDQGTMAQAIRNMNTDFPIFRRTTPMGDDATSIEPVVSAMHGKTALIIFTDGNSNLGSDPVQAFKTIKGKYGDSLCVHVVSFADTANGERIVNAIRKLFPCSVPADYDSLMQAGALEKYAQDVFYEDVEEVAPKAMPVPAPAPEPEVFTLTLDFALNKAAITPAMESEMNRAKAYLDDNSTKDFFISGHTDSSGSEAYNQTLSERRANAVRDWLIGHGIDGDRLTARGFGENNPLYDNGTSEGRAKNRRIEITTD